MASIERVVWLDGVPHETLGWLDPFEHAYLCHLEDERPELARAFAQELPRARQHALQRVLVALVREGLLQPATAARAPSLWRLGLPDQGEILLPIGRMGPFGRLEVSGAISYLQGETLRPLVHVRELFVLLSVLEGEDGLAWQAFGEEVANSSANLALSRAFARHRRAHWGALAERLGCTTALELARGLPREDGTFDPMLFFEQLCTEGHNLHPAPKGRLGMSCHEVLEYAPEFQGQVAPRWIALRRELLWRFALSGGPSAEAWLELGLASAMQRATEQLSQRGLDPGEFQLLPVHPWQFAHALPELFEEELQSGQLILLDESGPPCRAMTSTRTLMPIERPAQALKLSLHCQLTSNKRSLAVATVGNGPVVSALLAQVLSRETALRETFQPVAEVAGFAFRPGAAANSEEPSEARRRGLSVMVREDAAGLLGEGEVPIVASSLLGASPVSGEPLLKEILESLARDEGCSVPSAAALFLERYSRLMVPGFLTLLVRYGIALEGHLQNCVPVFAGASPVRMLVRDWEGCRIHLGRLARQGWAPEFQQGSRIITDSMSDLRAKVFYTVFQSHLGEIVWLMVRELGLAERDLWEIIHRQTERVFASFAGTPLADQAARDWQALYAPTLDHKALSRMRLQPDRVGYQFVSIPNPLHELRSATVS